MDDYIEAGYPRYRVGIHNGSDGIYDLWTDEFAPFGPGYNRAELRRKAEKMGPDTRGSLAWIPRIEPFYEAGADNHEILVEDAADVVLRVEGYTPKGMEILSTSIEALAHRISIRPCNAEDLLVRLVKAAVEMDRRQR